MTDEQFRIYLASQCLELGNAIAARTMDPVKNTVANALMLADALVATAKANPPKAKE